MLDATTILTYLRGHAENIGVFEHVEGRAIPNPPTTGLACAFEFGTFDPDPQASGLAATSYDIVFTASIYKTMQSQPGDDIELAILDAAQRLINAYHGDFSLGGNARAIDLPNLRARGGYVKLGGGEQTFRTIAVTIPIGLNDVFEQVS